jgi:ATP-dependent protease Clp ATPase subunit
MGAHNNTKVVAANKTAQQQARKLGSSSLGEAISSMQQEMLDKDHRDLAYVMTEAACVRFARDYGLVPNLMTKRELKEILSELNRHKMINIVKPSTSPTVRTA